MAPVVDIHNHAIPAGFVDRVRRDGDRHGYAVVDLPPDEDDEPEPDGYGTRVGTAGLRLPDGSTKDIRPRRTDENVRQAELGAAGIEFCVETLTPAVMGYRVDGWLPSGRPGQSTTVSPKRWRHGPVGSPPPPTCRSRIPARRWRSCPARSPSLACALSRSGRMSAARIWTTPTSSRSGQRRSVSRSWCSSTPKELPARSECLAITCGTRWATPPRMRLRSRASSSVASWNAIPISGSASLTPAVRRRGLSAAGTRRIASVANRASGCRTASKPRSGVSTSTRSRTTTCACACWSNWSGPNESCTGRTTRQTWVTGDRSRGSGIAGRQRSGQGEDPRRERRRGAGSSGGNPGRSANSVGRVSPTTNPCPARTSSPAACPNTWPSLWTATCRRSSAARPCGASSTRSASRCSPARRRKVSKRWSACWPAVVGTPRAPSSGSAIGCPPGPRRWQMARCRGR